MEKAENPKKSRQNKNLIKKMKKITFFFCALMLCLSARANYYVVGDFNGWDVSNAIELTTTDGTNYTVQLDTLRGGFKIISARDWNHSVFGASSSSVKLSVGDTISIFLEEGDSDSNINVAGAYVNAVLSFFITNNTAQLTLVSGTAHSISYSTYYIVGDFNGWTVANAIELTTNDEVNYTVQLDTLWGGFKITTARDWYHSVYGASSSSVLLSVGDTISIFLEEGDSYSNINVAGAYVNAVLSFSITNNTSQLTFVSGTIQDNTYYIKNNWNGGEWTWQEMTLVGTTNLYEYKGVFGSSGVNINTTNSDENASWLPIDTWVLNSDFVPTSGDSLLFIYDPDESTLLVDLINHPSTPSVQYYIKNDWGGGANEWTWQSMNLTSDGSWTYTGVFGIYGVNINTTMYDGGSLWFAIEDMNLTDPTMVPQEYDTVMFVYNTANTSVTATVIGRYVQANNTCADVNAITGNTDMTLGEVTVVFAKGSYVYVMDETATTMVYSSVYADALQAGNRVNGISGQARLYYTLPEFVPSTPVENLTIVSGEAPTIVDATSVPTAADVNRVMWFRNVVMPAESFTNSRISTINGTFLGETIAFRNNWKDAYTFDATKKYDMLGCVAIYNGVVQVYVTDFTEVVTQNYYIKNNWNAIGDWTWGQMTPSTDSTTWTYTGIFGGLGVNINMVTDDTDALWFPVADMILTDATMTPQEFDTVLFTYTPATSSLSATVVGRPESLPYYVIGDFNDWSLETAVAMNTTDGVNYTTQISSLWGTFKILPARNWTHGEYVGTTENCTCAVGQTIALNLVPNGFGPSNDIHALNRYSNAVLSFSVNNNIPQLTFVSGTAQYSTYYIVGDFNNWDVTNAVEMTTTNGTNYYVHLDSLWGEFKITTAKDWNHQDWGASYSENSFSYNSYHDNNRMTLRNNSDAEYDPNYNIHTDMGYSDVTLRLYVNYSNRYLSFESVAPFVGYTFYDNDFYYQITSQNPYAVAIVGNSISTATDLVIPDSIDLDGQNFAITAIADQAFRGNDYLTSLVVGNNVITIGAYAFNECDYLTNAIISDAVYSIGYQAFDNCDRLTDITIGKNVRYIADNAIYYCHNMTNIVWNAINCNTGERVFDSEDSAEKRHIQTIVIGEEVETIPANLFAGCTNVTSINLPNTLRYIGSNAFKNTGVTSITIPNSVTSIGSGAFYGCANAFTPLVISENVDTIGPDAFGGCDNLTAVTWNPQNCAVGYISNDYYYDNNGDRIYYWRDATSSPFPSSVQTFTFGNNVQTIPAYLCYNLNQIASISIPNGVTKIGTRTFYNCAGLASVTMPNSVKRIEAETFRNCTSLASINLSSNLDYIGSSAFYNTGLMSVMIPESLDTIVYDAFKNNSNLSLVIWNARNCANVSTSQNWNSQLQEYEYSYYESTSSPFPSSVETFIFGDNVQKVPSGLCSGMNQLTSIALPNTVRTIGNSAFSGCSGLISFTMENGVQTIGNSAFSSCSNLPQIVMPNTVTKIGNNAFNSCRNLTTAIVGNSVDTIGGSAFRNCERLISIELPATVNEIGDGAFVYCSAMNKAIIHSTTQFDSHCWLITNPQLDTIVAPASIFDVAEESWPSCTKKIKYVRVNSGELTENGLAVIRRSASTLETLDVSATSNTTIADEAFSNMYRLIALGLPQGLDRISYKAVAECVRLQSIDIPAGITEIGDRAFEDCRSLTTITFGGQSGAIADVALQTIGNWAFYNNHALRQIAITEGVTTIGAGAFYGCTYLEDLAMPASLRNVGDNAFALCNHLTKMQVEATLPPQVAARTFFDVNRAIPVYVPDEAVNDYRTTQVWQEFFIRPISQAATGIGEVEQDGQEGTGMLPDGKFMQNGQLFIRKNGRVYDTQGRLIE